GHCRDTGNPRNHVGVSDRSALRILTWLLRSIRPESATSRARLHSVGRTGAPISTAESRKETHLGLSPSPVAPTIFLEKPFDENVEELSHCGGEVCAFEAAVQDDDFEDSTLCSVARSAIEEPPWTNHAVTRSCPAPGASGIVPGSTLATAVSRGRRFR